MIEFDARLFDERIVRGGEPALVEFWAPWCIYCRLLKPKLERIGRAFGPDLLVGRLDVVEHEAIARAHEIDCVPGLAYFAGGAPRDIWYGDVDLRRVVAALAGHGHLPEDGASWTRH